MRKNIMCIEYEEDWGICTKEMVAIYDADKFTDADVTHSIKADVKVDGIIKMPKNEFLELREYFKEEYKNMEAQKCEN